MSKTLDFLKEHESQSPSRFVEMATWRKENDGWLRWSRNIALSLIDYMQSHNLSRTGLAEELGVTPQYVSKILSGKVNFSFKSVYEIENKLGISCMSVNLAE
ncbi:helix-turn-helix domain-containing protein [Lepagella muris]|jgi:ribosome-binding protein aMBF1 (putative translation factor)|uniref:XRE family transcriptional regulator n=1 Tax=Lepagella muris TaxID=3032870 RepID=A0AC61RN84_9BACT|nr:helix-turn-helix transcriptional regulator [Lepagella muris]ROT02976.1 XRE family transcriptional regulator [Muribaculaceae bacterium Isolate-037 (Harlan)]TGY80280.1 XRE family transcriptional regulator [Lepagella muris]THG52819.1 helix-turn-helix transcriptional regulator [Bacteroidales bacterium]TKC58731.1 helix-turn-helix transcriptional regulator [Bacteroidales bacterium]